MSKYYIIQTVFFVAYAIWAGDNYVIAHRETECAKHQAESAQKFNVDLLREMPLEKLTNLKI